VRLLCAFVAAGCVSPALVHDVHPVATHQTETLHPYGPEILWLDARVNGEEIQVHAQLVRGCWRDMIQTVDEHTYRKATLEGPGEEFGNLGGVGGPGGLLFAVGVAIVTISVSAIITGVVLLVDHPDKHREYDRPTLPQQEICAQPAPRLPLHAAYRGNRVDLETDTAGFASLRLLIPTAGRVFIETGRPGAPVLAFDYDAAQPLTISEHPEPPPPVLP
jgi:hypothetical protein